jgi:hypothetical protein
MYADDAAIFINPFKEDLEAITTVLQEFGNVSGLHINMQHAEKFGPPNQMPRHRPRSCLGLLHREKRDFPVSLLGIAATYETTAKGPRATPH